MEKNTSAWKKTVQEKGAQLKEKSLQKIQTRKNFWQDEWNQLNSSAKRLIGISSLISFMFMLFFWKGAPAEPLVKAWRYHPHHKKLFVCIGETNQPTLFWEKFVRDIRKQDYFAGYNFFVVGFPDIPDSGTFSSLTFGADSLSKALSLPFPESVENQSLLEAHQEIVLCGYGLGHLVIKKYLLGLSEKQNGLQDKIQRILLLGPELDGEAFDNWCYYSGISVASQELNSLTQAYKRHPFFHRTYQPKTENETRRPDKLVLPIAFLSEMNEEISQYSQKHLEQRVETLTQEVAQEKQQKENAQQEIQQHLLAIQEKQTQLEQFQQLQKNLEAKLLVQEIVLEGVIWNPNSPSDALAVIQGEPKKAGEFLENGISIVAIQKEEVIFFINGNNVSKKTTETLSKALAEKQQQKQMLEELLAEKTQLTQQKTDLENQVKLLEKQTVQGSQSQQELQQTLSKQLQENQQLLQEKESLQESLQTHQSDLQKVNKTLAQAQKNEKKLEGDLKKLQESYQILSNSKQQWQETIKQNERLSLLNQEMNQKLIRSEQNTNILRLEIAKLLKLKDIESASSEEKVQIKPEDIVPREVVLQDIPEANQLYLEAQNALNANKTPFAAFVGAGQISEAKEKFHKLLELYPHSTKAEIAAYDLANLYTSEDPKSNGALDIFKQCLSINPKTDLDVRLKIGMIYEAQSKSQEARFWYQESIQKGVHTEERIKAQQLQQQLKGN